MPTGRVEIVIGQGSGRLFHIFRDGRISSSLKNPYMEIYFPQISFKPLYRNLSLLFFNFLGQNTFFTYNAGPIFVSKTVISRKFRLATSSFLYPTSIKYLSQVFLLFAEISVPIYRCAIICKHSNAFTIYILPH